MADTKLAYTKLIAAVGLVALALVAVPPTASAQSRGRGSRGGPAIVGRAAPRTAISPRYIRPPVVRVAPYRPYYRSYRPGFSLYLGAPYYGGYPYYGYGYGYGYPGYGYAPSYEVAPSGPAYGGVRIDLPQRDAQVYADGYYAGTVNDFDGVAQHLDLTAGAHHIEVQADGFAPIAFDVNVQPGQTITYRADMRPN